MKQNYLLIIPFFLISSLFGEEIILDETTLEINFRKSEVPTAEVHWSDAEAGKVLIRPLEDYGNSTFEFSHEFALPTTADSYLKIEAELRAVEEDGKSSQAGFEFLIRDRKNDLKPLYQPFTVGNQWEKISLYAEIENDLSPGDIVVKIRPMYFSPVTELRNIKLVYTEEKPETDKNLLIYPGQELDAPWRKVAEQKIDKHRKANLQINLINNDGEPHSEATVRFEMLEHFYPFGTTVKANRISEIPVFGPESEERKIRIPEGEIYRKKLQELFNYVVTENDLKWMFFNGDKFWTSPEITLDALKWLNKKDFLVKGHTLVWASWSQSPDWLKSYEDKPDELQARILEHIESMGTLTRDLVDHWDVLNEPMSHRDLIEILGTERVAEWFKKAREVMPDVKLILNEFDIVGNYGSDDRRERFQEFVRELLAYGAPIDAIGFQSHFWSNRFTPPERIWEIIDDFEEFGLPLYVSEFDMNYPDEELQADYTRDFIKAWFSHPATSGFIMWGFWSKAHWFKEAGAMYRDNWEPKPNAHAYKKLVFETLWTDEMTKTSSDGTAQTLATFGDYKIEITLPNGDKTYRLISHTPSSPKTLTIIMP